MKYLFDNNLPASYASALNALDKNNEIKHLKEIFEQDTPDIEWMNKLAKEKNWVIITIDNGIRKNAYERKAWKESKLMVFFLAGRWTNFVYWDKAYRLIKVWPNIIKQRYMTNGYTVSVNGKIDLII